MTLEKREDTSKIKPSKPTEEICHVTAVQIRVIRYDIFPSSYSFISSLRPFHSPLAKSPTTQAQVATNDGYTCISKTTSKVSLFITFWKDNCTRERYKEYVADAPSVQRNPITYFPLGVPVVSSESEWTARREADMVRRTRELSVSMVNFWELRKKEKRALKANWVAQRRE